MKYVFIAEYTVQDAKTIHEPGNKKNVTAFRIFYDVCIQLEQKSFEKKLRNRKHKPELILPNFNLNMDLVKVCFYFLK